jgi:E3 ubiquitin-protein ligase SDIR1
MAFLITVGLLFMILNSYTSQNALLWVGMGVFLMASSLRMYALCQQLQAQAQAAAAATAGGLLSHAELRLRMPSSLTFATRARLHGLRLQLALLDREFDDLDYDALRALDADNPPGVTAMSDTDISRLPVRMYKGSTQTPVTESLPIAAELPSEEVKVDVVDSSSEKSLVDLEAAKQINMVDLEELTCSVCLEQVVDGEMVRTLPCLHQFHSACIDQWLRQQGTCPVCKFKLSGPETPTTGAGSIGSATAASAFRV